MTEAFFSIKHKDGVPWWEAPVPRRFHRCRVQTMGKLGSEWIYRCACGAVGGPKWPGWINRNARRKGQ